MHVYVDDDDWAPQRTAERAGFERKPEWAEPTLVLRVPAPFPASVSS